MYQNYINQLKQVESGNNPLAKNPKSTAKGLFQFVDATGEQYGLDASQFGTPEYTKAEETAALRLTQDNHEYLKAKLGREPSNGELYLAHQQGAAGAEKILTGDQNQKAVDVLGREEVVNNGGTEGMTLGEFANKWTSKFDGMDAKEQGLTQDSAEGEDQNQQPLEVDAFSDFGINMGAREIDAFSDFNVTQEAEFMVTKDSFGDIKKSMIDNSTGAPSYIRQVVGSLYDPESRLATLQKYYPDAQPYEGDNFIYTNPETQKLTLYNPKGLDTGDVASATKEAFVATGGAIGAWVGGVGGAAASTLTAGTASPVMVPAGVVVGGGLGAGIASNVFDLWMTLTGQTVDVRSPQEVAIETATEVVGSAAGEGVGRAIPVLAKGAIGGAKKTSQAIVRQFERFGIRPTLTTTQGAVAGRIESGLAQNVMSADLMQKQADDVVKQSHEALQQIIKKFGKPKTKQGAGSVISEAAEAAVKRTTEKISKIYDEAYDLVGADWPVKVDGLRELRANLMKELVGAPNSKAKALQPAIERLNGIIADADRGLDFATLRSIRTDIGRDLADPLSSGATSSQNLAMKRVYAALSDDMSSTAMAAGDKAASMIKRADTFKKAYEETAAKTLNKILKYDAEEKAYKFALSASRDGGSSLGKLRKLFTPEEWDDVSATVLSELGKSPTTGGEFSISHFVSNYNKLAPEAKAALFKGGRYQEAGQALDEFVGLMEKLKDAGRYTNRSNTSGAIQFNLMLQGLGMLGGGALAGEQTGVGGVGGAIGAVVAPRVAAKLITNPKFVKWLSKPVTEGAQNMGGYLGQLIAIGEANPEMKDSISELINAMNENTKNE